MSAVKGGTAGHQPLLQVPRHRPGVAAGQVMAVEVDQDVAGNRDCNSPVAEPQPPEDRHQQGYDGYRDRCHNEHAAGAKS